MSSTGRWWLYLDVLLALPSYGQAATKPLLGWGENNYGSLGNGDDTQRNTPQLIPFFADSKDAVIQARSSRLAELRGGREGGREAGGGRAGGWSGGRVVGWVGGWVVGWAVFTCRT